MAANKIETKEQFEQLATKDSFLLIKHSLTCPISGAAFEEYESFLEDHTDVNTAYLAVQEARALSNYVAETYGIKHESPQAILFKNGQPVWNASHWKITSDSLSKAIKE
ncbi:bacillithiol system redox-active protein YtxJ [Bacillus sp. V5-8f]|uniref:bacillithiol system redox-active protein YtxJ n=1 Tax=Bacillus sp. V5-8f TaxID=2053044 RepID=UPI000C793ADA|nr:bacillithiol system redox-active protein YtxJ [Bacillus sp. V5-8f]PLT32253.1 bacillithiol system redox-active protein YtxJ [Bacillus sp. V5-8f]